MSDPLIDLTQPEYFNQLRHSAPHRGGGFWFYIKLLLAIVAAFSVMWPAYAVAEVRTDSAAHFGMSFAISAAGYGVCKTITRMDSPSKLAFALQFAPAAYVTEDAFEHRAFCQVFGAVAAGFAGLIKEAADRTNGGSLADMESDLLADGLGIATFTLFTVVFDF